MASEIDICNLSLSRLGDEANISSIDPPDQSVQANLCAIFYPIALEAMLGRGWSFNTKRYIPPFLTSDTEEYEFCYALPSDYISIIKATAGTYDVENFSLEYHSSGVRCLYSDAENIELVYAASITNPGFFPPLFIDPLSILLSHYLAGPLLKGDIGVSAATKMLNLLQPALNLALNSDAQNFSTSKRPTPSMINARA